MFLYELAATIPRLHYNRGRHKGEESVGGGLHKAVQEENNGQSLVLSQGHVTCGKKKVNLHRSFTRRDLQTFLHPPMGESRILVRTADKVSFFKFTAFAYVRVLECMDTRMHWLIDQ